MDLEACRDIDVIIQKSVRLRQIRPKWGGIPLYFKDAFLDAFFGQVRISLLLLWYDIVVLINSWRILLFLKK